MKKSKFEKYLDKSNWKAQYFGQKEAWNAACKLILNKIKYRNKQFEGMWQHEDIDILIEEVQGMIEKKP